MSSYRRRPHRSRRTVPRLAAAITVIPLVLSAACTSATPPDPGGQADMAAYLTQEPDWGSCTDTATNAADAELFANPALECVSVEVPLDYDAPAGERAQLALTRLPARGEAEGSLLVNPGGPGGSGTSFVASSLRQWQSRPVAERFDIVGFDPRGIGASTPALDCYTDEEYDAGDVPRFGAVYDITSAEQAVDHAQRCIEGSGGVENLVNAGSANVVRDMGIMREVLGDERLTYLGYSYGSEIGAMYLTAHPDKVRAVVLDSAVGPDWTPSELRLAQFTASQARFDEVAALCARSPDCVLGPDPAAANERLHEIVAPLVRTPAPTAEGRDVSVWDVYLGITAGLAADIDTNIAVRCMDWPRLTPEEQTAHAREVANVAPMFGIDLLTAGTHHSECEAWPAPPTRDVPWLPADVEGLPEALVVSLTGDPATPYPGGVSMARTLGASLLTVDGKQHGAYLLGGSTCVDDAVDAYLLDLETPPADARCSL